MITTQFYKKYLPFLVWGKQINRQSLYDDLLAGLTGAIIVLPQSIAYALIAGLPPQYGFYTAIITPIVAGLFGSSRHLISGPTAPISIVVFSVTSAVAAPGTGEFITAVLLITLLAGLIQLGLGLARLGSLVNFISHTVVLAFTTGAACLIATSQLKYIFGVDIAKGSSFLQSWGSLFMQLGDTQLSALLVAAVTFGSALLIRRVHKKLPHMLLAMVIGSVVSFFWSGAGDIERVEALPAGLPQFALPVLSPESLSLLLPGAFAVALMGLVEAVSIARAIAIRSGQTIDGNQEFIGQGLSNIAGSCFSCYAGSGSFTRSGANYDAGAKTPIAAIFAAAILVLVLWFAPGLTAYLPLPAMGGLIVLIAWNLIDIPHIVEIFRSSRQEAVIFVVTFLATLLIELEFAIYVGVMLSLMLYLRRTAKPTLMEVAPKTIQPAIDLRSVRRFGLEECPQLKIIRIDDSLFFGAVNHVQQQLQQLAEKEGHKRVLLHCPGVNYIDFAGANMLLQEQQRLQQAGGFLVFCGMKNTVRDQLERLGFCERLGEKNFYLLPDSALAALVPDLQPCSCPVCQAYQTKL